jgi:hypothetical protein
MMYDLAGVQAGDKLFVKSRHTETDMITTVDRVTPSGRVITKLGQFNQDGRLRGDHGWTGTRARRAIEDDIAAIRRYNLVRDLNEFSFWHKLSPDDLKAASEIIAKYFDAARKGAE